MKRPLKIALLGLFALVAIAVVLDIGPTNFRSTAYRVEYAKYIKSKDCLNQVVEALNAYKAKHGEFPEFKSFTELVAKGSPLVQEGFIQFAIPTSDPWGNPFIGSFSKQEFRIECSGSSQRPNDFPRFTVNELSP